MKSTESQMYYVSYRRFCVSVWLSNYLFHRCISVRYASVKWCTVSNSGWTLLQEQVWLSHKAYLRHQVYPCSNFYMYVYMFTYLLELASADFFIGSAIYLWLFSEWDQTSRKDDIPSPYEDELQTFKCLNWESHWPFTCGQHLSCTFMYISHSCSPCVSSQQLLSNSQRMLIWKVNKFISSGGMHGWRVRVCYLSARPLLYIWLEKNLPMAAHLKRAG